MNSQELVNNIVNEQKATSAPEIEKEEREEREKSLKREAFRKEFETASKYMLDAFNYLMNQQNEINIKASPFFPNKIVVSTGHREESSYIKISYNHGPIRGYHHYYEISCNTQGKVDVTCGDAFRAHEVVGSSRGPDSVETHSIYEANDCVHYSSDGKPEITLPTAPILDKIARKMYREKIMSLFYTPYE